MVIQSNFYKLKLMKKKIKLQKVQVKEVGQKKEHFFTVDLIFISASAHTSLFPAKKSLWTSDNNFSLFLS